MNPFDKPTCGFACPEEHRCLAHGHEIPETANFYNCDVCNTPIINPIVDITLNKILCERCYVALGTCAGCANGSTCLFETDPSPLPKVVTQTIRQGNMVGQIQVKNPERIKVCCEGCHCFIDNECYRTYQYCKNHRFS